MLVKLHDTSCFSLTWKSCIEGASEFMTVGLVLGEKPVANCNISYQ